MSIETLLMESAQRIREEAVERSKDLQPPQPRRRVGLAIAATAVSIVIVIVAVIAVNPTAAPDEASTNDGTTSLEEPLPEGWTTGASPSAGVEYRVPEEGWQVIEESLTPNLDELPGDPQRRFIDTIISFATYPAQPGPATDECAQNPQTALEQLGATDALISVLEYRQSRVSELPDRPRPTGRPQDFYPYVGEGATDNCYDRVNIGRSEPVFIRSYVFNDNGRAFNITVAIGPAADDKTRRETWTILDRLTFQTRP